ncbi:MAG: hypothetical protein DHS20C02_12290 [Micavibrio sp.]|nr:MAG: hypothetical protein DHS20C02_12290 [Micavibrio sp.]
MPIRMLTKVFFLSMVYIAMVMPGQAQDSNVRPDLATPQFFASLQDVPLMPGLTELTDYTVVFDKPEGRIIESVAAVESLTPESIRTYYEASLPQLGWRRIGDDYFARQGEYLRMNFETVDGQDFLKIIIMPHG